MGARLDDCTGSGIAGHLIVQVQGALSEGINAGDSEATEAIKGLVETSNGLQRPSRPGGVTVEIAGRLNTLLREQARPNKVHSAFV
jgi:site-specific DNA recombinase